MRRFDPSSLSAAVCGVLSPVARSVAFERADKAQIVRRRSVRRRLRTPPPPPAAWEGDSGTLSARQRAGHAYEQRAADYLRSAGLQLLARNVHTRCGEIDLIAMDGAVLVFVEVRARAGHAFGGAAASVTPTKQRRVTRAADGVLPTLRQRLLRAGQWKANEGACRFDVVAFESDTVHWIKHAFTATR